MEYRTYEDMNTHCNELQTMRDTIELMPKFNQVEILRILTKNSDVTINENKYGIHINLTDLNQSLIEELKIYIRYVRYFGGTFCRSFEPWAPKASLGSKNLVKHKSFEP